MKTNDRSLEVELDRLRNEKIDETNDRSSEVEIDRKDKKKVN
jgi:hypothetical protein